MTNTQRIIHYASRTRGPFRRKDLHDYLTAYGGDIKEKSIDVQIRRLLKAGWLQKKGWGEYILTESRLPEFVYLPSQFEKGLHTELKLHFPFLDFCIWSPKVLSSLMLHVPDIGYTLIDVEKDGIESLFHTLQSMGLDNNILLSPSMAECNRYLAGTDSIVVRQLIGRAPVTEIDGCNVPMIEKILIDCIGDNELLFARGSEIYNIFENAFERYNINRLKLQAYASRRNRKDKLEQILKTTDHDKP